MSAGHRPLFVVTYPEAVMEKVVSRQKLNEQTLRLRAGERVDITFVEETLRAFGFRRVDYVYEPGQFAVRGSILDVFSFSSEWPYRVDFFGDEVDSIRTFEVQTQLSRDKQEEIVIVPELAGYVQGIVGQALQSGTQSSPIVQTHLLFNPQMKSAYNFVPGVMGLILMLICAMMTSISIVREKETGTMEVLLVSPIRPIFIILAKAVPYLVLSCVNLATILLLSVYVLHVPVEGSLWTLSFLSLLLIAVALSLGLLISCVVQNQVAAMIVSGMGLMMPVMLLSGMIFPIESMPAVLQWISNIIPARWYIQAVKKVMIEGLGMAAVWHEALILSGMAALLIGLSLKKFKERLE